MKHPSAVCWDEHADPSACWGRLTLAAMRIPSVATILLFSASFETTGLAGADLQHAAMFRVRSSQSRSTLTRKIPKKWGTGLALR
jgi:hypothetical protein